MKSIAMLSCLLLSSLMFTCDRGNVPQTIMKKKSPEVLAKQVQIKSCAPDKDQVQVHDGDAFTWYVAAPDTNSYEIVFMGRTPIGSASVTATPGQPAQATIQRDAKCKENPKKDCYYSYFLIEKTGNSFCQDPGMHIIP